MFGSNLFGPTSSNIVGAASRGLSFSKILSGAGKALNFANRAIPMYYQIKPMLSNAKTLVNMYSKVKEPEEVIENNNNNNVEEKKEVIKQINSTEKKKQVIKNDTLTFFQ